MSKDYAKFVPPKSRLSTPQRGPITIIAIVIAVLVLIAGLGGLYLYTVKSQDQGDFLSKLSALIHHQKIPAKPAAKLASAATVQPRTVRFDFYEQLPNMQMPAETTVIASAPAPAPLLAETPKIPAITAPSTAQVVSHPAFDPDQLTHLLESEQPKAAPAAVTSAVAANHFIIQMGDFDTDAGAKGLVAAIKSVGFEARVVKISRSGRTIYQVQQGPYENMALATQSQLRMQKRGLISTIVKAI
jgi:cell division protein FtsN